MACILLINEQFQDDEYKYRFGIFRELILNY